ncbi:MAG: hypothetical protein KBH41_19790 [Azonexus sp.]|nr:hypothetical protein [Azonexus sp.]
MTQKADDIYTDSDELEGIMEDARMNASTDWEESFVADMKERFDKYGMGMFISDAQREHLERIANDE